MKLKNKLIIIAMPLLICGSYIAYKGYFGAPVITVCNHSSVSLKNIKVSGGGYSKIIPEVKPKEKFSFVASAKGETGVIIDFESPNGRIFRDDLAYIEQRGGYGVLLTINNNFEIKTDYEMNKFSIKRIL